MNLLQWSEFMSMQLKEFSDPEFQYRVWLRGEGPEVSSFDEAINLFFDHYDGFLDLPAISSNQILSDALKEVYLTLKPITDEVMSDKKIDEAFLKSPLWKKVIELATNAKIELDKARAQWLPQITP